jgi:hypothetical protein
MRKVIIFSFLVTAMLGIGSSYALAQMKPDWTTVIYSPFNLIAPTEITNPVLTADDVTDVSASFVADPFLFYENGNWYMFFEVLNRNSGHGDIGVAMSSDGFHWNYDRIVLDESWHLSYPHVFKYQNEYYMIPASYVPQAVNLYKSTDFPYNWNYVATIASGRVFTDISIFLYKQIWWLFAGEIPRQNCYLYYSNELTAGWTEHPMSPIVVNEASKSTPGGRSFIFDNNRIIRIAQKCDVTYGEQVRAFEVDILSITDYAEHEIPESPILDKSGTGWNAQGMHNFDPWWNGDHWLCAVDGNGDEGPWSIGIYIALPEIKVYLWEDDHQKPVLTTFTNPALLNSQDGQWDEFKYSSRPYPGIFAGHNEWENNGLQPMNFFADGIPNGTYEVWANLYTARHTRYYYGFNEAEALAKTRWVDNVRGAGGSDEHEEYYLGMVEVTDGSFDLWAGDGEILSGSPYFYGWAWVRLVRQTSSYTYTIMATAGPKGTITPSGRVIVTQGDDQTFEIIPDTGYQVLDVLVRAQSLLD